MTPRDPLGDDANINANTPLPDELRWQLRQLRRDQAPARELWPDIAARLAAAPPRAHADVATRPAATRRRAWPVALAATLALAIGVVGWQQDKLHAPSATPSTAAAPSLFQREAAGMTRQYRAALIEIDGAPSTAAPALQPAFDELDRNAQLILSALERDPDSRLLLQQLRRTYSHRLALAQRAALS